MTGTPEGIAPVKPEDLFEASLKYEGQVLATISDRIIREEAPYALTHTHTT